MKKTFITNLALLVGLNLLVKPFYLLVVETEIQNRVGADVFGSYFALINFSFILNILPDLGTTNWNTRKIAEEGRISSHHFSGMIFLRLILALLYLIISMTIGYILEYSPWQLFILFVLTFNQVMVSGILYLRSYLTGLHLFKSDSIISILDRILMVIMMSFLLWGGLAFTSDFKIEWLVWGQTISYGITLIAALILVLQKSERIKNKIDYTFIRTALKESSPFAILIFVSMLGYRIDSVMLERMSGSHETGIYAMGFRFFEAVNMISYLFAVLLLPIFTRMLKHSEPITTLFQLSFKLLYSGIFMICILSMFHGKEILEIIYDNNIQDASPVFSWLMMSSLFFSLQYVTGTLITASGKMKPMILIALAGMVYNVLLNSFYIPEQGALGAAKASCFSQAVIFLGQLAVVTVRYETGNIRRLGIQTIIFSTICILFGLLLSPGAIFSDKIPFGAGILLLVMLLTALSTRMLDISKIPELLKERTKRENSKN